MRGFALVALACYLAMPAWPSDKGKKQEKEEKEEQTQTRQLPQELPTSVVGNTHRLVFHVTPLSAKGLLSQQSRDALKALMRQTNQETVLKIRAFVAGTGDMRRVRDLVSEVFTQRRRPLPVITLVQAGGLPLTGAQVVLETISEGKKETNPFGLAFFSASTAVSNSPYDPVAPLTEKALAALRQALKAAGAQPADVLRVTCFLSSLDNFAASRKLVETEYPGAALNYVQTQREPGQAMAACEAVARLRSAIGEPVRLLNQEGSPGEPGESLAALVAAPHVLLTGAQISFGYQESDSRLAFERLAKELDQQKVSTRDVVFAHYYPLSTGLANQVRKLRAGFFDSAHPPAGSMLIFEGLPSMDAGFAVDVIAVKE